MMLYILASDPAPALAMWGQIAAIFLVLQTFIVVLIALAVRAGMAFIVSWTREKAELVKKIRPLVDKVNTTTEAAIKGASPAELTENKAMQIVAQIPAQVNSVEEKVEKGSDRVANTVIEFRARTVMVQSMLKAFFLPGLTRPRLPSAVEELGPEYGRPGLGKLEKAAPEVPVERTDGYNQVISSQQRRDAPVR